MPDFLASVAFLVSVTNKNFFRMIIAKKSSAVLALTAVIFLDFVGENKFSC